MSLESLWEHDNGLFTQRFKEETQNKLQKKRKMDKRGHATIQRIIEMKNVPFKEIFQYKNQNKS